MLIEWNSYSIYGDNQGVYRHYVTRTHARTHTQPSPFQRRTQPSSPDDANTVPVMFHATRHTFKNGSQTAPPTT